MNKFAYLGICIAAMGCKQKSPVESFVDGYSLTDEATIQMAGIYSSVDDGQVLLSICEVSSKEPVLLIEKQHGLSNTQHVIKLDRPKIDASGQHTIRLKRYTLKNTTESESLCAYPARPGLTKDQMVADKCTAEIHWNGHGFDGAWSKKCGGISDQKINLREGQLTIFSDDWQKSTMSATAFGFTQL